MGTVKQGSGNVVQVSLDPLGSQQIVGLAVATTLTVPTGASRALIQVSGQPVRFRSKSTDAAPTASSGIRLTVGQSLEYDSDLAQLRFIQEAASATLDIEYYG
jgi:hypothetical protein